MKIALIQLAYSSSINSMKEQCNNLIAKAAQRGAELVCLPEFSLIPYFPGARQPDGFDYAEPIPGGTSEKFFSEMAKKYKVKIVGSLYEEAQDGGLFGEQIRDSGADAERRTRDDRYLPVDELHGK